ncbi:hypothetical protein GCM10009127_26990 [Alteraurantiacibacter aestuarii]|uniref:tRNA lysidine(34) synthetase TilS n=1 Tax=Alteraurantiacibacter aestuarii TaxID=650004 RepID=UPI0031D65589
MSTAPTDGVPPQLVERFAEAADRLNPDGDRIGLAVSGGPDSMAMLLLAHAAIPGAFEVATVDHGLRAQAADECALVVAACEARGIACATLKVQVSGGNLQQQARAARYAALGQWAAQRGLAAIATAHHADDQAETLLMRLNRGSGVAGLAGVREYVWMAGLDVPVIRPLLQFRRAELATVIEAAGIEVAHDPSNAADRFDRVRIRKALADADWIDPLAMARSAAFLAEADEALETITNRAVRDYLTKTGDGAELVPPPDRAIALRVIERIITGMGGSPRGSDVARLHDRLERGEGGNIGGVLATTEDGLWIFRPEPPRRTG